MTTKRGPKNKSSLTVPLSVLVSQLPPTAKVKVFRVWYEETMETLGINQPTETNSEPVEQQTPEERIQVSVMDFNEE